MATNATGTAIYTWSIANSGGTYSVYAQRYNTHTDLPADSSPTLLFSSPDEPTHLTVGIGGDGQYVVAYDVSDGTTVQAFARIYDPTNQPVGNPIAIDSVGGGYSIVPAVSVADNDSFVVAWQRVNGDGTTQEFQVEALRYNADGSLRDGANATPIQLRPEHVD